MVVFMKDGEFIDEHGRTLNLRGVNVSGSSKLPSNYNQNQGNNDTSSTQNTNDANHAQWLDTDTVTFINKPFPITPPSIAHQHFSLLQSCGFTILRFLITWEALEHSGPGIYDHDYIHYIRQVLEMSREYGMYIYLDPHQDVWSRWTGGDGAPLWTLEVVGFDVRDVGDVGNIGNVGGGRGVDGASGGSAMSALKATEAALCKETYGEDPFPKMIWPTNYFKLACATMFTLFWAGERFAKEFMVEVDWEEGDDLDHSNNGENGDNGDNGGYSEANGVRKVNIQTYLQTHYILALKTLLSSLRGLDNIIGIGTMNEPSTGYINIPSLSPNLSPNHNGESHQSNSKGQSYHFSPNELKYGLFPTPFQGMCLGEGLPQDVGEWSNGVWQHVFGRPDRVVRVDPKGRKAWMMKENIESEDSEKKVTKSHCKNYNGCIWKQAGVWRIHPQTHQPELLKPNYFANVDFGQECYLPFATKFAKVMREVWNGGMMQQSDPQKDQNQQKTESSHQQHPQQPLLLFVEMPPLEFSTAPFPQIPQRTLPDAVNATHWYDGVTLFTQTWRSYFSVDTHTRRPIFGYDNIFKNHVGQLKEIKELGRVNMEGAATLIGECGVPFDMNGGKSYEAYCKGDEDAFGPQLAAMDHTLSCLEENLLSFTLWCYTPDNNNREGDLWNGEDLSIYSPDQARGNGDNAESGEIGESGASGEGGENGESSESNPLLPLSNGLRAPRAYIRPYARAITGRPTQNKFHLRNGLYTLRYTDYTDYPNNASGASGPIEWRVPTEIFVPKIWCASVEEMDVRISSGRYEVEEKEGWFVVRFWHGVKGEEHCVKIQGPGLEKRQSKICRLPSFLY